MPGLQVNETFTDIHFPKAGIDLSMAFSKQPNKPMPDQSYARSTPLGVNVRGFEPVAKRSRGGQRAGLSKYLPQPVGNIADWIVQELTLMVTSSTLLQLEMPVQASQSGRVVTLVAVSQGNIFVANAGDTAWTSPTNNTGETPPLNYTGVIYSTANNQKLWFADGINWVYYDPNLNTINTWAASAGSLPVDSAGNTPRLICTWRGRIVLAGLLLDPQDWFMSAVSDPTNFDYSPLSTTPSQAIAGQNSPLGFVGDVVTALIPYTDDVLIFGGDHSIFQMTGDPMAGGQIDLVSDAIGIAWGQAWTKDPYGTIYFVSNKTGIYSLIPGQKPQRISQGIEQLLLPIDTGANIIRLIWDDRFQGLHVFCTLATQPAATTHFFYEQRTGAWWTDTFSNINHNPICCVTFDGNTPGDRVPLIGSWDGYVRAIDPTATTDDGFAIQSAVVLGPLLTQDLDEILCTDVQAVMGVASGQVSYAVYIGPTAEAALASTAIASGVWGSGRNPTSFVRRAGHAIYVKMTAATPWAMEQVRLRLQTLGKIRRRRPGERGG